MLDNVQIVTQYFKKINFLYLGKERPAKTILMPAKLRAVLVNFGFSDYSFSNSAQCVSQRGV